MLFVLCWFVCVCFVLSFTLLLFVRLVLLIGSVCGVAYDVFAYVCPHCLIFQTYIYVLFS